MKRSKWSERRDRIEEISSSLILMGLACVVVYGSVVKSYIKYKIKGR